MKRALLALVLALIWASGPARAEGIEFQSFDEGLKKAGQEKKLVMVYFWADWCRFCKKIEAEVFADQAVRTIFDQGFVGVSVNIQKDDRKLSRQYRASALPTLTFIRPDGEMVAYWEGAADPETFLKILTYVQTEADS